MYAIAFDLIVADTDSLHKLLITVAPDGYLPTDLESLTEICSMTRVEQLYNVARNLPPAAQAELLDFAEFLSQKNSLSIAPPRMPLARLAGGLEHSANFSASPLAIQENLRREWD